VFIKKEKKRKGKKKKKEGKLRYRGRIVSGELPRKIQNYVKTS